MKTLKLEDVTWTVEALEEDTRVRGNAIVSGDAAYDKKVEDKILRRLRGGNIWAWCIVKVTGRWNGLEEDEYLGCCCYDSLKDFTQLSGYYDDMRAEILDRLQARAEIIATAIRGE
jgi:hypothetical protein